MTEFTTQEKLKAIEKELAMRRNVYAKWVASGKMKPFHAEREIAVMEAIRDDYANAIFGGTMGAAGGR